MDKIALLEKFAEQFGDKDNVVFDKYRCARIKNTRSKCRVCTQVCPHNAVKISGKSFFIDEATCTGCGACVTSCPLSVFALNNEPYADVADPVFRGYRGDAYHSLRATAFRAYTRGRFGEGGAGPLP